MDNTNTKTFETVHKGSELKLVYNLDKMSVRVTCEDIDHAFEYLRMIIIGKKIGAIDAVVYSMREDSVVVYLIRGTYLNKFLRQNDEPPHADEMKQRRSFSQMAATQEKS